MAVRERSTLPSLAQAERITRVAIYARVSTNNGQDPEMQLREVREYCARRGWSIADEYVDRGISGSKERRPELDRLLVACRRRRVDAVVVYRYDRFARSLRQLVNAQELRRQLHDLQQSLRDATEHDAELRARIQHDTLEVKSQLRTLTKDLIAESRIVLTTAVQTCLEPAISESPFDISVIDEASMMPVPYVLCVGTLSAERVVVTGDFRQLGPIALGQTAASYRWLHTDPFKLAGIGGDQPQHPALTMLQVQRRMHAGICELINKTFYAGRLKSEAPLRGSCFFQPLPGEPAVFVSLEPDTGSKVEQTQSGSRLNRVSADFVAQLVCRYLEADDKAVVGVIAPYRAQVTYIRRLLRELKLAKDFTRRIRLGTVHAFQGSEADVIIWDLVETRDHKIGRLYQKETGDRLTNVAISRAQEKLVLVGDTDAFYLAPGRESVGKLRSILSLHFHANSRRVVPSSELQLKTAAATSSI